MKPNFVIGISLTTIGVIGLFSPFSKVLSIFSAVLGTIISLYSLSKSNEKEIQDKYCNQAIAQEVYDRCGKNIYSEAIKRELYNEGSIKNTMSMLDDALSMNPNDKDAIVILGIFRALKLSFQQAHGMTNHKGFLKNLSFTKKLIERGLDIHPNDSILHDVKGILLDIESKHEEAREEFTLSGKLGDNPYWHIHMATSWQMSGEYVNALEEVKKAISEGAENVDFYYGSALQSMGNNNSS